MGCVGYVQECKKSVVKVSSQYFIFHNGTWNIAV